MGYPVAKRILDLSIAVVLLVVLAPVFGALFVAIGIAMLGRPEDRGPLLYRESRISRGREFELLKFRTLRRSVLATMEEPHARLLEADESNLTWAGRRLLKPWYLDELPQLWNILRGDMSLVGPRPWPPSMVARQVADGLTYRNDFVAGWTGPAHVALDLAYVNASRTASAAALARTDARILWRTLVVMSKGEGLRF